MITYDSLDMDVKTVYSIEYIAIKHNGKYRFIKNWNDSYLSELGTVLYRCYNTARRVNALIDLGNTYVVGKHLDNSVSTLREWINLPISESCTASVYRDISRWDNEMSWGTPQWEDNKPQEAYDIQEISKLGGDYLYIFDTETNQWTVGYWQDDYVLRDLRAVINSPDALKNYENSEYSSGYRAQLAARNFVKIQEHIVALS